MTWLWLFLLYAVILSTALARNGVRVSAPRVPLARRPTKRVLIIGATGGTGRHLVIQALERGLEVTALVRNPARLDVTHPRLTILRGDVLDAASVDTAVRNQDAVISALGHKRYLGPSRILSTGTRNLIDSMTRYGVSRLVCETSLGIGSSAGRMGLYYTFFTIPIVLPFYFWDKTRQEKAIAASQLDWVIVRPGSLTNAPKRGTLRHGLGVGNFLWTVRIPRADVASFMLDQLEDHRYTGAAVGIC